MEKFVFVGLFLALLCCANADDINFKDCGSKVGKVSSVLVNDCDKTMKRCTLRRNHNATVEIRFTSAKAADAITALVHGVILDVPVPFSLPNDDACNDSGIQCPVESGKEYLYTATLPVLQKYPRVTVDVKWELKSGDDSFACVLIPAKIQ